VNWEAELLLYMFQQKTKISVQAVGMISGEVPERGGWTENTTYPEYSYQDKIGGYTEIWY